MSYVAWFQSWQNLEERNMKTGCMGWVRFIAICSGVWGFAWTGQAQYQTYPPMMNSDNIYLQLGDRNPPFLVVDGIPRHWNDAVHDSKISEVEIMADSFTVLSDFQELMAL